MKGVPSPGLITYEGECSINGDPGSHVLKVVFADLGEGDHEFSPGDSVAIWIDGSLKYCGILEGSNIQIHLPEEDD
ncbi:hypothetical protein ACFLTP_10280 [Chloroflexota bacterium]